MWVRLSFDFGAASLVAVGVGAAVCAMSGVPASLWVRNLVGWVVGAGAAAGLAAAFRPVVTPVWLWVAPLGLAATFLGPEQLSVHRWLDLGPLSFNAAMLLLPSAVVALAVLARDRAWPWIPALASLALLVAQPDASQATALAIAMGGVALTAVRPRLLQVGIVAAAAVLVGAAWFRPDPLAPVPEVEGVIGLAMQVSPVLGALAVLALFTASTAPALLLRRESLRIPALALSLYLSTWCIMPFLGAFPVPWAGVGLSPILGAWLGVGLLAGLARRPA